MALKIIEDFVRYASKFDEAFGFGNKKTCLLFSHRPHMECSLIDLCCGAGAVGLALAPNCGQVVGLDAEEESVDDARYNAMRSGVTNAEFHQGSLDESLPALWQRVVFPQAAVVVQPPKKGELSFQAVSYIRR